MTIRQTASTLIVETSALGQINTQTFTLDGQENTNHSGATVRATRTRWDGAKLVTQGKISQVTSQGYDEWTMKEVRSIDARGQMVVEREFVGLDGKKTNSTLTYTRRK